MMRRKLQAFLRSIYSKLEAPPDLAPLVRAQRSLLDEAAAREMQMRQQYVERAAELIEARQMSGAGPWLVAEDRGRVNIPGAKLKESNPLLSQGAYSDIELALQNVEWRREVNLSWLEFSRWGIQQIILISRLYYIKNPIVQRLVNVCAAYVFARGVEVTTEDDAANETLAEFFERNKRTLGQIALVDLERRKDYDGNLFFVFFTDQASSGKVTVRTIDATEIMDIVTDPEDTDTPWFYRRQWTARTFKPESGTMEMNSHAAWYPALGYDPADKPQTMNQIPVKWESPVHHRKVGAVSKWNFGCPRIYAMLDWAKESKRFLEACATVKQALAKIAMTLTTKGGQQAIEGAKQQLMTTVGTGNQGWDTNPAAVNGSIFASGPGTTLAAFKTSGAGGDPEEVRQYKLMCCMVKGVPETFLGDVSTGNLATATSLDRPTETVFLEMQESWVEDLGIIAKYVLNMSAGAPGGKLRESFQARKLEPEKVTIREAPRTRGSDGRMRYLVEKPEPKPNMIEVRVNFPAIREGDVPALIDATCKAIKDGGLDPKVGVRQLCDLLPGIENADEIAEMMYPQKTYKPDRTKEPVADPNTDPVKEGAARRMASRLIDAVLKERNGNAEHHHAG